MRRPRSSTIDRTFLTTLVSEMKLRSATLIYPQIKTVTALEGAQAHNTCRSSCRRSHVIESYLNVKEKHFRRFQPGEEDEGFHF